ncbi:MAG: ribonucleoside reductase class II [Candidatus Pacebacteria bacterium]|nr:ribonucleoside reductase class II [Candidatus Paceibacterota bacterium]
MGVSIVFVIKRDGKKVPFSMEKISSSIIHAGKDTGEYEEKDADRIVRKVEVKLASVRTQHDAVTVQQIRDVVEPTIAEAGYFATAKYYILYGEKKQQKANKAIHVQEPELSPTALEIVKKRYLRTDMNGVVIETPGEMLWRVARHMAKAEIQWGENGIVDETARAFYERMVNLKFVCAGKAMFEAGNPGGTGQLSSCFVLPIDDSIQKIFKTLGDAAVVHKNNGGTGFNFSKIRPHGDKVKNVPKASSGPVDFLKAYSAALSQILQGAKRQGANIAILNADHPDIVEFITLKDQDGTIKNFNISVGVSNEFMEAVQADKEWDLMNPRNGEVWKTVKAREVFDLIAEHAWATGDPGLAFLDRLQEDNPTPSLGVLNATNPCITGDARIPTEYGLLRFDEVVKKYGEKHVLMAIDSRLAEKSKDGVSSRKAHNFQCTGMKKIYEIKTVYGFTIRATAEHKFMTTRGWIEVKDLNLKDTMLIQSGRGLWSAEKKLESFIEFSQKYPDSYPKVSTERFGEFLGYLVGDGSLRSDAKDNYVYVTFGKSRQEIQEYFEECLSGWGLHITNRSPNNRSNQLWMHNKIFAHFLVDLGVLPVRSEFKRVPECIYKMHKAAVSGFLRGLFSADGTVNFVKNKSSYVRLTSKSKELLRDVQTLLLNFGIFSKIYNRSRKARVAIFPEYTKANGTKVRYGSDGVLWELEISKDQVQEFIRQIGFIGPLHHEKIDKLFLKTYYKQKFEDQIFSITEGEEEPVFDVTEPDTHSFIANGFVVHNCGEIPLLPYESCNLTSIDLNRHLIKNKKGEWEIDWDDLEKSVKLGVRFLDDMIEVNTYALDEIRQMVKEGNRRIGIGVMGYAHMLYRMRIPYNSEEAVRLAERIAKFMRKKAEEASIELGKERGAFPNFDVSIYAGTSERYRNCAVMMIAPTGTISLFANTSSGIEPVFSLVQVRRSFNEDSTANAPTREFTIADPIFDEFLRSKFDEKTREKIMKQVVHDGNLDGVKELSREEKRMFVTTHTISPEWHVRIQAAWQKWIDNSVSKTINFPNNATIEDVKKAYLLGWKLGLKGITIYRDGSKVDQVLNVAGKESALSKDAVSKMKKSEVEYAHTHSNKPASGEKHVCPECAAASLKYESGCVSCPDCGWSKCTM